ncbi:universal stress protein [Nocardioides panacisoli]|uniref:universal stress protein n=1 Tax=Nocardioides panacisoli TaxID=627624 RepID=UPI001C62AE18|nr:universal stress protein [Nocardioides panacisoli]QYJ03398.1 universal stress protein [Nocardioides panacisoli]
MSNEATAPHRRHAVVVGVDGSEGNHTAITYAAEEALAAGRALRLVTAVDQEGWLLSEGAVSAHAEKILAETDDRTRKEYPDLDLETRVRWGHPVAALMHQTGEDDVLVVGTRGLGALHRALVGSTSIRVASRADAPVMIVPSSWAGADPATAPIVVGIDPERDHGEPLRFAVERARRLGASVRVVHAVDLDAVLVLGAAAVSSADIHDWEQRSSAAIETAVAPFREDHPEVTIEVVKDRGHAAAILLDNAADAQLIVLGRRHRGPSAWGLGSVAREVLHRAELPVAVVPIAHK